MIITIKNKSLTNSKLSCQKDLSSPLAHSFVPKEGTVLRAVNHGQFITIDGLIAKEQWKEQNLVRGLASPWARRGSVVLFRDF